MEVLKAPLSVGLVIKHLDEDFGNNNADFYHNFVIQSCVRRNYTPELILRKGSLVFINLPDDTIIVINNNSYELKAYGVCSSHKVYAHIKHNISNNKL